MTHFEQSQASYPPLDGSLFLPEMLEFNAKHNPTRPFYTFYDEPVDDLCHVSHLEFYRACQRVAHVVRPDRQGPDNAIVAIIANCDTVLYQALTMGVIYAGLIVRHVLPPPPSKLNRTDLAPAFFS
ncbi:hypothetical protein J3R83DRAFT_11034 [Lanmaoa asiatica]|nr:hypothetical protein J3R83DRAFT_11034 [Lanmaoa asiatica]